MPGRSWSLYVLVDERTGEDSGREPIPWSLVVRRGRTKKRTHAREAPPGFVWGLLA